MPIYEFQCKECGTIKEILCKEYLDRAMIESECAQCEKTTAHDKIMSAPNHIYKGSGFYATDYKKKSGSPKEKKE